MTSICKREIERMRMRMRTKKEKPAGGSVNSMTQWIQESRWVTSQTRDEYKQMHKDRV